MKKLMLTLVLLMSVICGAMAQNDAMYVYRNDGVINAFLKSNIDHVCYSQLDVDSVAHAEYVVQEVWAVDSVYRIPLEKIDSVSFITPKTVYQPGTVNITSEMREYIIASDSLMLTFAQNTPTNLLPQLGDKLVNTEASGGLLSGFVGKVKEIENTGNGYSVYCDAIDLTDVFECYYGMYGGDSERPSRVKNRRVKDGERPGIFEWNPGKLTRNLISTMGSSISYEPDGNLLVPSLDDAEISFSLTPKIYGSAFLIINREYGVNLNISIYGDYTLEEYMALAGSITGGGDLKFIEKPFPIPEVLCDVDVEFGAFLRAGFQISTEQKWTQRYNSTFHYEWSSKGQESLKNINDIRNVENTHSGIVALKGICEGGLYAKVGLAFFATSQLDIAEVGLRLEGGLRFEGTALPYISNKEDALKSTDLYNTMKGQGVELSAYYGTSAYANLFSWSWNKPIPNWDNIPFEKKGVIKSCNYVPEFKNTKLEKEDNYYIASFDIFGNCDKTDIGFSLQCKDNPTDRVGGYSVYDYNGPSSSAHTTFYKTPSKDPYIVYPLVKFGELEMIAEPSAEVAFHSCPDNNHPHAIDLGLPSGTKWACCNVGASSPEQPGGYYAWGETKEKSVYYEDTYQYYTSEKDEVLWDTYYYYYINIGSGIAGTSYDVAHVHMGRSWRMPSVEQQKELINNCTRIWTKRYDVYGMVVKGKNGGEIFFPAAGYRWDSYLYPVGFFGGFYWSSSLYPDDEEDDAYYLDVDCYGFDCRARVRCEGLSVRAVCP